MLVLGGALVGRIVAVVMVVVVVESRGLLCHLGVDFHHLVQALFHSAAHFCQLRTRRPLPLQGRLNVRPRRLSAGPGRGVGTAHTQPHPRGTYKASVDLTAGTPTSELLTALPRRAPAFAVRSEREATLIGCKRLSTHTPCEHRMQAGTWTASASP